MSEVRFAPSPRSAQKVKTLVDEVSLGSQEQARGIEQISKALTQMDQVTQERRRMPKRAPRRARK